MERNDRLFNLLENNSPSRIKEINTSHHISVEGACCMEFETTADSPMPRISMVAKTRSTPRGKGTRGRVATRSRRAASAGRNEQPVSSSDSDADESASPPKSRDSSAGGLVSGSGAEAGASDEEGSRMLQPKDGYGFQVNLMLGQMELARSFVQAVSSLEGASIIPTSRKAKQLMGDIDMPPEMKSGTDLAFRVVNIFTAHEDGAVAEPGVQITVPPTGGAAHVTVAPMDVQVDAFDAPGPSRRDYDAEVLMLEGSRREYAGTSCRGIDSRLQGVRRDKHIDDERQAHRPQPAYDPPVIPGTSCSIVYPRRFTDEKCMFKAGILDLDLAFGDESEILAEAEVRIKLCARLRHLVGICNLKQGRVLKD